MRSTGGCAFGSGPGRMGSLARGADPDPPLRKLVSSARRNCLVWLRSAPIDRGATELRSRSRLHNSMASASSAHRLLQRGHRHFCWKKSELTARFRFWSQFVLGAPKRVVFLERGEGIREVVQGDVAARHVVCAGTATFPPVVDFAFELVRDAWIRRHYFFTVSDRQSECGVQDERVDIVLFTHDAGQNADA